MTRFLHLDLLRANEAPFRPNDDARRVPPRAPVALPGEAVRPKGDEARRPAAAFVKARF